VREETARTVANVVVGAAAIGAAVVILRTPALRRVAFGLLRTAAVSAIPAWLAREVKQAWQASDPRVVMSEDTPDGVAPQPPGDGFPAPSPVHDERGPEFAEQNLGIPGVTGNAS
jgi:hypothetical protein